MVQIYFDISDPNNSFADDCSHSNQIQRPSIGIEVALVVEKEMGEKVNHQGMP